MSVLARIEAIVAEIERLDAMTNGQFRDESDREAFDIVCRIERRMLQNVNKDGPKQAASP